MDGVVGPHTWAKLTETQQVTVTVVPAPPHSTFSSDSVWERNVVERYIREHPGPHLTPLPPDIISKYTISKDTPPSNRLVRASNRLVLDSVQLGAGEQGTLSGGLTGAHSLQIVAIILNRKNKPGFHNEIQFGALYLENYGGKYGPAPGDRDHRGGGPGYDSKRDLGFLAILNQANMPGMGGRWSWGIQEQLALMKSLYNGSGSLQGSGMAGVNLSLKKDKRGNDMLQLTGQAGLILELDPPGETNGYSWVFKAGAGAFLGLTGTLTLH